jgi:catechol 2,3-dioxygenase-like lactoylglutathione lyase family enzyme
MIGYVTLGTNDLQRAAKFYDAVLGQLGAKRHMEMDRLISWSAGDGSPGIGVCKPYDGQDASIGNGSMVALHVDSPEKVKALYDLALELGGSDEGAPGLRFGTFYAAYFRDPDGNKLNAFCMTQS